jgi:hypothetical protein
MEHPWYKSAMRHHFEDALARLGKEQDEVEEKVSDYGHGVGGGAACSVQVWMCAARLGKEHKDKVGG